MSARDIFGVSQQQQTVAPPSSVLTDWNDIVDRYNTTIDPIYTGTTYLSLGWH